MVQRAVGLLAWIALSAACSWAGGSIFSPNGLGEQLNNGGARVMGLGGAGLGMADSLSYHSSNPALSCFARRSAIRFGGYVGFWNTTADGKTDSDAETVWKDWRLSFPLARKWSIGVGADPLFRTDIHSYERKTATFVDPGGENDTEQDYEERDAYLGSDVALQVEGAYRASALVSVGLAMRFHLYRFERTQYLDFDTVGYRDIGYSDVATYRGWSPTFGLHWQATKRLGVGGFFTPRSSGKWNLDSKKADSDSTRQSARNGDWPGEVGLGIAFAKSSGWMAVGDFTSGMWQTGDLGMLYDSAPNREPASPFSISAGVERSLRHRDPEASAGVDAYRAGIFFRRHAWATVYSASAGKESKPVADVGAVIGGSLFVAKGAGRLHAALEAGMRGDGEELQGATENYFRIHLQVEMTELWFQKNRPRTPR